MSFSMDQFNSMYIIDLDFKQSTVVGAIGRVEREGSLSLLFLGY